MFNGDDFSWDAAAVTSMVNMFNDTEQYGRIMSEWHLDGQYTMGMFGNNQCSVALCLDDIIDIKQITTTRKYM